MPFLCTHAARFPHYPHAYYMYGIPLSFFQHERIMINMVQKGICHNPRPSCIMPNGTEERQTLTEPRQGRKAATVGEFLWVFGGAIPLNHNGW